jgi:hypothetical protein
MGATILGAILGLDYGRLVFRGKRVSTEAMLAESGFVTATVLEVDGESRGAAGAKRAVAGCARVRYSCRVMQRPTATTYPASSGFVVACAG